MIVRARYTPIDQLIRGALRHTGDLYADMVACSIDGSLCSSRATLERAMTRALILAGLLGHSRAWRLPLRMGVKVQDDPTPVEPVQFRLVESLLGDIEDGLIIGPFLEAIRAFERRIPTLASTVRRLTTRARRAAASIVDGEASQAAGSILGRTPGLAEAVGRRFWVSGATQGQIIDLHEIIRAAIRQEPVELPAGLPDFLDRGTVATLGRLTRARLEVVYRNNTQTAFNDGQVEVLSDPVVKQLIPLAEIDEIRDRRTRGNPAGLYPDRGRHWQMHGYVGTVESLQARGLIPPAGHQCRATLRSITFEEARTRGFVDENGQVDHEAIRRHNGERESIVARGEYPDPGWN